MSTGQTNSDVIFHIEKDDNIYRDKVVFKSINLDSLFFEEAIDSLSQDLVVGIATRGDKPAISFIRQLHRLDGLKQLNIEVDVIEDGIMESLEKLDLHSISIDFQTGLSNPLSFNGNNFKKLKTLIPSATRIREGSFNLKFLNLNLDELMLSCPQEEPLVVTLSNVKVRALWVMADKIDDTSKTVLEIKKCINSGIEVMYINESYFLGKGLDKMKVLDGVSSMYIMKEYRTSKRQLGFRQMRRIKKAFPNTKVRYLKFRHIK